jgi:hypothetical protein
MLNASLFPCGTRLRTSSWHGQACCWMYHFFLAAQDFVPTPPDTDKLDAECITFSLRHKSSYLLQTQIGSILNVSLFPCGTRLRTSWHGQARCWMYNFFLAAQDFVPPPDKDRLDDECITFSLRHKTSYLLLTRTSSMLNLSLFPCGTRLRTSSWHWQARCWMYHFFLAAQDFVPPPDTDSMLNASSRHRQIRVTPWDKIYLRHASTSSKRDMFSLIPEIARNLMVYQETDGYKWYVSGILSAECHVGMNDMHLLTQQTKYAQLPVPVLPQSCPNHALIMPHRRPNYLTGGSTPSTAPIMP